MESLYKGSNILLEELREKEIEGEVWAFKEKWAEIERGRPERIAAGKEHGFALRWRKERGGTFFQYTHEANLSFDYYPLIISEPVDFPLPSVNKSSKVLIHDPGGITFLKGLRLPEDVVYYREVERSVSLMNTKGYRGEYKETSFLYTYREGDLEYNVWTRKRKRINPLRERYGRKLVLHPVVTYKLINYILSSNIPNLKDVQISILENPKINFAPGSYPFDAIGMEMKKREIFKKGKLLSKKPVHYLRFYPESPPSLQWTNIEVSLPYVNCEDYSIIKDMYIFRESISLKGEKTYTFSGGIENLLKRIEGKIADGWFIGPPFIKSDYILVNPS